MHPEPFSQPESLLISANLNSAFDEPFYDVRHELNRDLFVNKEFFSRIAHGGSRGLCVNDNPLGHVQVSALIDKHVAVTVAGFDHGNRGVFPNKINQLTSTARNQHIDESPSFDEFTRGIAGT